ncbi:MAG TPA: acetate/propionate family kinase [Gammaproteobacteria bacterium]|nr:acetate/propionate family kinase [Gammaproteobacteria bacterium]
MPVSIPTPAILVINAGSSSLKFAIYAIKKRPTTLLRLYLGAIEDMDSENTARFSLLTGNAEPLEDKQIDVVDHQQAMTWLLDWLEQHSRELRIIAAGHRLVHGGPRFTKPVRLDRQQLEQLRDYIPLAPLHMPHNLAAIEALWQLRPALSQVACFDTAFHRTMPEVEQIFALPRQYYEQGIRRYGFHGLSYEYIASVLPEYLGEQQAQGRIIVAHLGHGASLCALHRRKSMATSMSFTPLDGIPMATRPGALDPGVLLYLLREKGLSLNALETLLNHQSGLLGLSGFSGDMRQLLADERPAAAQAITYFVHHTQRAIASLAAALGGLDALVFTAGIGENAPLIRARICQQAAWLGVDINAEANAKNRLQISLPESRVSVWCIATNEELIIAQHTHKLITGDI